MVELAERKTPLLRWRGALLKLECLRPAGGFDDRAVIACRRIDAPANARAARCVERDELDLRAAEVNTYP